MAALSRKKGFIGKELTISMSQANVMKHVGYQVIWLLNWARV